MLNNVRRIVHIRSATVDNFLCLIQQHFFIRFQFILCNFRLRIALVLVVQFSLIVFAVFVPVRENNTNVIYRS